ncbi:LysM peptidoglycan-binding domain-containing protein [Sporosarcina sp. CAU 1771]
MAYGIYFSANSDKEGFQLPVNPSEVNESGSGNGEEYTISGLGSINVPKFADLEEYELESYFPKSPTHLAVTPHVEPSYYVDYLKKWKVGKKPIRYIYADGSFTINELVTVEKFDFKESDASGDVYFELKLKKYVPFAPKKMIVQKPKKVAVAAPKPVVVKKAAPPRQNPKPEPKTYSLVKGDSLWKVAQKFLGNGNRFREIANLNGIKDSQFRRLPIGLKVKLPPK